MISIPPLQGRYFLIPVYDLFTEVLGSPGTRTTGDVAVKFAISPPGWAGTLPPELLEIKATTFYVFLVARAYTAGTPEDLTLVHAFQDGFSITPLSNYIAGTPAPAPVKVVDPNAPTNNGIAQAVALTPPQFLAYAAELLKIHPPHASDNSIIVPGKSFNWAGLDPVLLHTSLPSKARLLSNVATVVPYTASVVIGWSFANQSVGNFGNFYFKRAAVSIGGLWANAVEDSIYPGSLYDNLGMPLDAK